jgi:hypothetical protein
MLCIKVYVIILNKKLTGIGSGSQTSPSARKEGSKEKEGRQSNHGKH